jgi:hypothetical protein
MFVFVLFSLSLYFHFEECIYLFLQADFVIQPSINHFAVDEGRK